jgi:hypothetical protein
MKPFGSVGMQFQQCPARLISPIFTLRPACFYDRNSGTRRKLPHSRGKIGMLIVDDEPENTPARATAEAMKCLPTRADGERRRLLLMKRAERLEICASAFERKIRADYVYDVVRGSNLLDHFRRDRSHARLIILSRLAFEAMSNLRSTMAFQNSYRRTPMRDATSK